MSPDHQLKLHNKAWDTGYKITQRCMVTCWARIGFGSPRTPPPQNKSTLSLMLHRGESLVGWGVVCALSQPHSVNTDSATGGNGTTNHGSAKLIRNKGLLSKSSINWYLTVTSDIWVIEWGGLWWKNYFPNRKFIIYIYIYIYQFFFLSYFVTFLKCFGLW